MDVKTGQKFKLTDHLGFNADRHPNDEVEQILSRHHPLFAGQVGTVAGVVPAGTDGGGQKDEEVAVLTFDHHPLTDIVSGEPVAGEAVGQRNVSFTAEQLSALFEPVADDAAADTEAV